MEHPHATQSPVENGYITGKQKRRGGLDGERKTTRCKAGLTSRMGGDARSLGKRAGRYSCMTSFQRTAARQWAGRMCAGGCCATVWQASWPPAEGWAGQMRAQGSNWAQMGAGQRLGTSGCRLPGSGSASARCVQPRRAAGLRIWHANAAPRSAGQRWAPSGPEPQPAWRNSKNRLTQGRLKSWKRTHEGGSTQPWPTRCFAAAGAGAAWS